MQHKPSELPNQEMEAPGMEQELMIEPEVIRENYKGSGKLKDKVALITGGDSGIGRSAAVHFAREGADVAIVYYNEDADALETKRMVEKEGRKCLNIAGDVKNEYFCQHVVSHVVDEFGKLNILVNNAATQSVKNDITDIPSEQFEDTFRTNFFAYYYFAREAIKHMKPGDTIINTTSVTAYRGSSHLIDYSSTKGAIVTFTRSLAKNVADKNIRVNGVAPGPIYTPLVVATKDVSDFGKSTALGRAGQPSELGPAYVFLASEDSSYVTGQIIHVNGGDTTHS